MKTDTVNPKIKLSEKPRIIKKVFEISDLKLVVIDNDIAKHLGIDANTFLEQSRINNGIIMKINSANSCYSGNHKASTIRKLHNSSNHDVEICCTCDTCSLRKVS